MNELEVEIRRQIAASGPISFASFMRLALYHPGSGYYSRPRDPFGIHGDYYTNSQLQPVFGRLIGEKIAAWQESLGRPADFTIAELGSGRGETTRELRSRFPAARFVEVEYGKSSELPDGMAGVIFANEFLDALPVHVVRFARGGFVECFVGIESSRLAWVEGPLSSGDIESYLDRFILRPAPGQIIEVSLEALKWIELISRSLTRGFFLAIDYGYLREEISDGRRFPDGSLMSYCRHTASPEVLLDPGKRDITAHVNFSALSGHCAAHGLQPLPLQNQAQFLLSIGEKDEFRSALSAPGDEDHQRNRGLLKTLIFEMGETFRVLVAEKA